MATATTKRRRLTRISLREDVVRSGACQVDREAGIIRRVKVVGLESRNGRRYTLECLKRAIPLYEGCAVNIDHPVKSPSQSRSAHDRFGKFQNVIAEADGLYADLHYLKSHPMAATICEAAERMPDAFGFSHNAQGDYRLEQGVEVVEAIVEVRSVDLVADPATTRSLFESEDHPVKTLRDIAKADSKSKFGKLLASFLEDAPQMGDVEMEPDGDEGGDWKADVLAAVKKLLDADDEDSAKAVDALMKIVKPAKAEKPVEEEDGEGDGDGDKSKSKKDDDKMEAIQRELAALKRREKVRELCESAGVTPDRPLLEALIAVDEKTAKALIEREKGSGRGSPKIRSGNQITESRTVAVPEDRKAFLAGLRRR